jgi:hypothetical protein
MEECIICFYEKPLEDYICFSCGHKVCSMCYPLMQDICPVCRYRENEIIQIKIVVPRDRQINEFNSKYCYLCIAFILCIVFILLCILI